jgi:hypothetical protein
MCASAKPQPSHRRRYSAEAGVEMQEEKWRAGKESRSFFDRVTSSPLSKDRYVKVINLRRPAT